MQAVYPSRMIEISRNATGCFAATICGISWANMTTRRQARIPVSRNIDLRDDTKTSMEVVVRLASNCSVDTVCVLPEEHLQNFFVSHQCRLVGLPEPGRAGK